MPCAAFKDLCIDAQEPHTIGSFWAGALGLELHHQANGDAWLAGPTPAHTVWINRVPEPIIVKQRVHLDVHASAVTDVENLGASVVDALSFRWVTMADPEGGELCVFVRDQPPDYRLYEIVIDSVDPAPIASWWQRLIGGRLLEVEDGLIALDRIPDAPFDNISFVAVPEPKRVKNRIHIDLLAPDTDAVVSLGANLLRRRDDEIAWDVLADPEDNEFCVFTPPG